MQSSRTEALLRPLPCLCKGAIQSPTTLSLRDDMRGTQIRAPSSRPLLDAAGLQTESRAFVQAEPSCQASQSWFDHQVTATRTT